VAGGSGNLWCAMPDWIGVGPSGSSCLTRLMRVPVSFCTHSPC
jgi:hypothetical protein